MTRSYTKRVFSQAQLEVFASNLEAHLNEALQEMTSKQFYNAFNWYNLERVELEKIAGLFSASLGTVAAVTAVLSPLNEWQKNKNDTRKVLRARLLGESMPNVGMKVQRQQAFDILQNGKGISEVTKGNKVIAFYNNLRYANSEFVTIDRHMLRVFEGKVSCVSSLEERKLSNKEYAQLSNIVANASYDFWVTHYLNLVKVGIHYALPSNVQSLAWAYQLQKSSSRSFI